MDLYEALKSGTSIEELIETFNRDLDEANARITAEKEEEANKEYLAVCRAHLAKLVLEYVEALLGEDCSDVISIEAIEEMLLQYEKELSNTLKTFDKLNKEINNTIKENNNSNTKSKKSTIKININKDDINIINEFIKNLK